MRFLDTNIIVRYLTRDEPKKAEASFALLLRVERGEEVVVSSDVVISETVYVLSSRRYGLSRQRIRDLLEPVISLQSFRLPRKSLYPRIWELYCQRNIGFADAYNVAYMEAHGINEVYSYDTDFDRVEGIQRVEPET